jgi:hypothetical protein
MLRVFLREVLTKMFGFNRREVKTDYKFTNERVHDFASHKILFGDKVK